MNDRLELALRLLRESLPPEIADEPGFAARLDDIRSAASDTAEALERAIREEVPHDDWCPREGENGDRRYKCRCHVADAIAAVRAALAAKPSEGERHEIGCPCGDVFPTIRAFDDHLHMVHEEDAEPRAWEAAPSPEAEVSERLTSLADLRRFLVDRLPEGQGSILHLFDAAVQALAAPPSGAPVEGLYGDGKHEPVLCDSPCTCPCSYCRRDHAPAAPPVEGLRVGPCPKCGWTPTLMDAAAMLRQHHVDAHGLAAKPSEGERHAARPSGAPVEGLRIDPVLADAIREDIGAPWLPTIATPAEPPVESCPYCAAWHAIGHNEANAGPDGRLAAVPEGEQPHPRRASDSSG